MNDFYSNFTLKLNENKLEKILLTTEGFEPSPFQNSALNYRLRPLGHIVLLG
jgi:hypothetical protein